MGHDACWPEGTCPERPIVRPSGAAYPDKRATAHWGCSCRRRSPLPSRPRSDKEGRWKASQSWPSGATMRRSIATYRVEQATPIAPTTSCKRCSPTRRPALSRNDWQPDSMLAWLYTIAGRRFADEARRRSRSAASVRLDDFVEVLAAQEYASDAGRALRESLERPRSV